MELPATQLRLPAALPYPLTVQRIHAQPGAHVQKTQRLFTYSFLPNKPDELGRRERQVREWDSPVLGQVIAWDVCEGDIIREPRSVFPPSESERRTDKGHMDPDIDARDLRRPIVKVQEPCTHDVQLNGLCAICGKDLTACVPSSRPENFDPNRHPDTSSTRRKQNRLYWVFRYVASYNQYGPRCRRLNSFSRGSSRVFHPKNLDIQTILDEF